MKLGLEQKVNIGLGLQQKLIITPQLQQAIKLLQLNHVELAEVLQEELLENPVLEFQESDPEGESAEPNEEAAQAEAEESGEGASEAGEAAGEAGLEGVTATAAESLEAALAEPGAGDTDPSQEELFREVDWDAYFQDVEMSGPTSFSMGGDFDPDMPTLEQRVSEEESLYEHLVFQLHMAKLNRDQQKMALLIIGSLDERGWLVLEDQGDQNPLRMLAEQILDEPTTDLVRSSGHTPTTEELLDYWQGAGEKALRAVHRMEPTGVGARSLKECLLLQAWQRDDLEDPDLIERLLEDHLSAIERRNYPSIAKQIKISLQELLDCVELIRQLDPYPSRNYEQQPTSYIAPDIYIKKVGSEYEVSLNDDGLPQLKINGYYKQMLRNQDKKGREFIQDKLRSAHWLLRSIQQRKRTIFRVTESIVKRQKDFLDRGIAFLKPMILKDVAQDVEMHESTISRVTTNKYVHTPQGVFELKFFFTSSLQSVEGGEDVSSLTVKEKIRQLIANEDPKKPLSDQDVVKILQGDGIHIARRTVAKYRGQLGIAASSKRKRPY